MDQIVTDAELHEADWCTDARLYLSRRMGEENREAWLVHKALMELKMRRDSERTTKSSSRRCSSGVSSAK